MGNSRKDKSELKGLPEPEFRTKKRRISIVWLVPLVALAIGGWLVYKALSEKGPTITITFKSAAGLEAGKTKIKYKDVELGQVDSIDLDDNLSQVILKAELVKKAKKFLSQNTRFWVVRARVAAGGVSGLGTLFSGAYIGLDPGEPGRPATHFEGLETPPVVTTDLPGSHFVLRAASLGSLNIGAPVYFRRIEVGQVVSFKLDEDGQAVTVGVFVHDPHHNLVRKNTRFYNASGLDVDIGAEGIRVDTESLVTLMIGGLAFDTPVNQEPGEPAAENDVFQLYKNRESISEKTFTRKSRWLLYFGSGVRGLTSGAPVELNGIQIGSVLDVNLEFDVEKEAFSIPVLIETEPGRIKSTGKMPEGAENQRVMDYLVAKGMRAQLKTGSLITGQLLVALEMHPEAPPAKINWDGLYPEFPTIPTTMEEITTSLTQLLKKLEKLPIEQIGNDLRDAVSGAKRLTNSPDLQKSITALNQTLNQAQKFVATLNTGIAPELKSAVSNLNAALIQAQKLAKSLNSNVAPQADRTLKELQSAARSIKIWAEYLERHPEALIRGKGKSKRR
ncbi:Paraquat-inducible protein B [Olavius sp. associated proteobacterium Delta 1]|nr:Paraquat-inducible protein B [Olavius sp. associated proteobacterium Delta 1]